MAEVVAKGDMMLMMMGGGALAWFHALHSHCMGVCVGTFVGDDGQAGQVLLKGDVPVLVLVEDGKDAIQ